MCNFINLYHGSNSNLVARLVLCVIVMLLAVDLCGQQLLSISLTVWMDVGSHDSTC